MNPGAGVTDAILSHARSGGWWPTGSRSITRLLSWLRACCFAAFTFPSRLSGRGSDCWRPMRVPSQAWCCTGCSTSPSRPKTVEIGAASAENSLGMDRRDRVPEEM